MNDLLFEIDNIDYKATALHVKHFLDTNCHAFYELQMKVQLTYVHQ